MSTDPVEDANRYALEVEDEYRRFTLSKEMHKENFYTAILKSPEQSLGNFSNVLHWDKGDCALTSTPKRVTAEDVLLEEIDNSDMWHEVASAILKLQKEFETGAVESSPFTSIIEKLADAYGGRKASIFDVE